MKLERKRIAVAVLGAVMTWATPTFAQDDTSGDDISDSSSNVSKNWTRPGNFMLSRLLRNPERAPADLQDDVIALQESMLAIRNTWLNEFRPGDDATVEEIKAAREAFQAEYAEQIAANKELRVAVMRELRGGIKDAIDDSEWNEEARALYAEYKATQAELAEAWRAIKAELGEDATREDIAAAKARFAEANAELIAQQKELAKQVRELIRENRQQGRMARDPLSPAMQELRNDMAVLREQVQSRKRQAREDMQGMTREEREQYRQSLLTELKDLHDEIKERRREAIDEAKGGQNGDRRPEG